MYKCPNCGKTSEEMKECEECKVQMVEVKEEGGEAAAGETTSE